MRTPSKVLQRPPPRPSPQGGGRLTHSNPLPDLPNKGEGEIGCNPLPDPPREIVCTPPRPSPQGGGRLTHSDPLPDPPRKGGGKLSPQGEGNCPRKGEGVTRRRRSRGRVRATAYRRGGARCTRPWDFPAPRPRRPARRCARGSLPRRAARWNEPEAGCASRTASRGPGHAAGYAAAQRWRPAR